MSEQAKCVRCGGAIADLIQADLCNRCYAFDCVVDDIGLFRQSLTSLACYAATARQSNTPDWMQGLANKLNNAAKTLDEPKVFVWHHIPETGECWITCEDKP